MDRSDIKSLTIKFQNRSVFRYRFRGDDIGNWPYQLIDIAVKCIRKKQGKTNLQTFKDHFKYKFPKENYIKVEFRPTNYAVLAGTYNKSALYAYDTQVYTIDINKKNHPYKEWNQIFKDMFKKYEIYLNFIDKNYDKKINFYEYEKNI